MPERLPDDLQRRLEHTLSQWRHWRCDKPPGGPPRFVRTLGEGLSNTSVLVEAGARFVVRLDGDRVAANGLNRQAEWRTLVDAHAAGLAPCPRYFNPELGSLVCDYLPPDPEQPTSAADIAGLVRGIHALPARHHRVDLAERIQRYARALVACPAAGDLLALQDDVLALLPDRRADSAPVLCHNDLLAANRLYSGGRLYAIDWEYSGMGSPWYDLAAVVHGDNLGAHDAAALLEQYCGRPPTAADQRRLLRFGCVYRYLELLWFAARDGDVDRARLAALLACLDG